MKAKVIVGIAIIGLMIAINSCENKVATIPLLSSNCDTTGLKYSTDSAKTMQTIINANCANHNCHVPGGTAPTDYTTYAKLKFYVQGGTGSQFYTYLFVNQTMPLSPYTIDACTKAKFKEWLLVGAPQ